MLPVDVDIVEERARQRMAQLRTQGKEGRAIPTPSLLSALLRELMLVALSLWLKALG